MCFKLSMCFGGGSDDHCRATTEPYHQPPPTTDRTPNANYEGYTTSYNYKTGAAADETGRKACNDVAAAAAATRDVYGRRDAYQQHQEKAFYAYAPADESLKSHAAARNGKVADDTAVKQQRAAAAATAAILY